MSAIRSPAASVPPGLSISRMNRFFFCWRASSIFRDRNETETLSSRPSSLIQSGRTLWPERRVVDRRAAAQLVHACQLGRALGGALAEAFLARPFRGQDAARAGVPGRLVFGDLVGFQELVHVLRKT